MDYRPALPPRRLGLVLAGTALLTPDAYLAYVRAVRWLQGSPVLEGVLLLPMAFFQVLVLSLTAVLALLGWDRGLRVAPPVAVGGLLVLPWLFPSVTGSVGTVSYPLVGFLVVAAFEAAVRFPEAVEGLLAGRAGRYALAAGLAHFLLGFGLQVYARRLFWMDAALVGVLIYGGIYLVSGLALFATGALSVVLWRRRRLVTPAALTAGWFLWGLYGTWQMRDALPTSIYSLGVDWISLQPAPDYVLQWTVLAVGFLVLAGGESVVRSAGRRMLDEADASVG